MRILFLTSLYSTPLQPARGLPNARIAKAMRSHADLRVIAPLPYYPAALVRRRPDLLATTQVPFSERDEDGNEILHPRYAHVPRVGRALYASLFAASIASVVKREVEHFRPDVILSAWAYPDGVAAVSLAKVLGVPSVLRVMGSDVNSFGLEPLRRPQIRWALENATKVISVSSALRNACFKLATPSGANNVSGANSAWGAKHAWSGANIDVIHTGVDRASFFPLDRSSARWELGVPDDKRLIVVPARLSPEKGVSTFVEAFASLPQDCIAVLVGDGPELARLRQSVAAKGLQGRVLFAGHEPEPRMRLYYSAADLVCLPSLEEGWPNVLMESVACGCPWVASNVGGVPELFAMVPGGALCRPSDAADLARAMRESLSRSWDRAAIADCNASPSLDGTARRYVETCRAAARAGRPWHRFIEPPRRIPSPRPSSPLRPIEQTFTPEA